MTIEGLDALEGMLANLEAGAEGIASQALYDGAGIVADALSSAAGGIKTEPFGYAAKGHYRLPSPQEVAIIQGAVGVAKFQKDGLGVNTIVGFKAGYGDLNGKTKPVMLIVNSINSGTSFMHKQPFASKAIRSARTAAYAAIAAKAEELIKEKVK